MNATYQKETGKSFLILEPETVSSEFAARMLLENKIFGLLPFEKRSFNGETQFFYDISGKHSLESVLEIRLLTKADLSKLFQSMCYIVQTLHSYFLDAGGIVLEATYIYEDTEKYYFCYDPSIKDANAEKNLISFAEELLGYIDYDDEATVFLAYRFYRIVKEEDKSILRILEEVLSEEIKEEENEEFLSQEIINEREEEFTEDEKENLLQDETEQSFIHKRETPDYFTVFFFALLLCVCLGYIGYEWFVMGVDSLTVLLKNKNALLAVIFVIPGIMGAFAGFIDIDIKRKK